ncbi:MAG: ROK family protein [Gemmatimonadota bacterium]
MNDPSTLVVDIGGSHVKALVSGETEPRAFRSGPELTAVSFADRLRALVSGWSFDRVALGYPGPVAANRAAEEPANLGDGWMEYDFAGLFHLPTLVLNDAALQALGSDQGGRMLFLGLGTGLGSALVLDGLLHPTELAHLPYRKKRSYEEYLGEAARHRRGNKRWRTSVQDVVELLSHGLQVDYVVLGGGNARRARRVKFRVDVRFGSNRNAFLGGFRAWERGLGRS